MYSSISVIMLGYKNYDNLDNCLKSLISQKLDNFEVVLCDDGTPNLNQDLIRNKFDCLKEKNIKTKFIFNPINLGTVKNFNNGIRFSDGDLIIPLALDDELYDENTLNDILKYFNDTNALIATSYRQSIDNRGNAIIKPNKIHIDVLSSDYALEYILKYGNFIAGANLFYSRDFLFKMGLFDEQYKLLEDFPFIIKVLKHGYKISFFPIITIKYSIGYGISTRKHINLILQKDRNKLVENTIKDFSFRIGRFMKFRNKLLITHNKLKKFLVYFLYLDVSINYLRNRKKVKK